MEKKRCQGPFPAIISAPPVRRGLLLSRRCSMTASLWDQRFAIDGYVFGTEPNAFLKREAIRLPPHGRVLAVADGEGRNGVFLAQRGFDVVATDIPSAGLAKEHGRGSGRERGCH